MKFGIAAFLLTCGMAWAAPAPSQTVPFGSDCAYPKAARDAGVQGVTGVYYIMAEDGTPQNVLVLFKSPSPELDQAAVECVRHWKLTGDPVWKAVSETRRISIIWTIPKDHPENAIGKANSGEGRPHVCSQVYPAEGAAAGIGGTTLVGFRILEDGTTADHHVLRSSGSAKLDNAAKACVSTWRYKPAMKDGTPVAVDWRAELHWVAHPPGKTPSNPAAH